MRNTFTANSKWPSLGTSPFMSKVSREEDKWRFYVMPKYMDVSLLDLTNNHGKYNPNYKTIYKQSTAHWFSEVAKPTS